MKPQNWKNKTNIVTCHVFNMQHNARFASKLFFHASYSQILENIYIVMVVFFMQLIFFQQHMEHVQTIMLNIYHFLRVKTYVSWNHELDCSLVDELPWNLLWIILWNVMGPIEKWMKHIEINGSQFEAIHFSFLQHHFLITFWFFILLCFQVGPKHNTFQAHK